MQNAVHPVRAYRHSFKPKVSLDSLAKSIGRSKATLSRIENWKQPVPHELVPDLSAATGISARELRPDLVELLGEKEPAE